MRTWLSQKKKKSLGHEPAWNVPGAEWKPVRCVSWERWPGLQNGRTSNIAQRVMKRHWRYAEVWHGWYFTVLFCLLGIDWAEKASMEATATLRGKRCWLSGSGCRCWSQKRTDVGSVLVNAGWKPLWLFGCECVCVRGEWLLRDQEASGTACIGEKMWTLQTEGRSIGLGRGGTGARLGR